MTGASPLSEQGNPHQWKEGRWRGGVYAAFFGLIALAAVFAHRAYAPLMLILLAAVDWPHALGGKGALRAMPARPWTVYIIAASLFCVWGAISLFWTPLPEKGDWVLRYAAIFILAALAFHGASYLTPAARIRAAKAVAWGTLAMGLLLSFEAATGGLLRRSTPPNEQLVRDFISLGRGTLLLSLLVWPAQRIFAGELSRPLLGWFCVALAAIPAFAFTIETNIAMLAAGVFTALLTYSIGQRMIAFVFILFAAAVWLTPLAAGLLPLEAFAVEADYLPDSWRQRLHIYARAGAEIFQHPVGGGVEYARYLSRPMVTVEINGVALNTMPLHPHNLFLHVWMDLGIVGAISLTGILYAVWLTIKAASLTRTEAAMIAAITAALLVTATTEWSLWQVWRFASVWIALIACRLAITTMPIR